MALLFAHNVRFSHGEACRVLIYFEELNRKLGLVSYSVYALQTHWNLIIYSVQRPITN